MSQKKDRCRYLDLQISDPDALERKAKEIREQQSRQRIMEVKMKEVTMPEQSKKTGLKK